MSKPDTFQTPLEKIFAASKKKNPNAFEIEDSATKTSITALFKII